MIDEVRGRADTGDWEAQRELPGLLITHGLFDELRARADGGDPTSARLWIKLLELLNRTEDLRARGSLGVGALSRFLAKQGRLDELRALAAESQQAMPALVTTLGNRHAASKLAEIVADRGDEAALSARADAGDDTAARTLDHLLHTQRRHEALHARAEAGDTYAASLPPPPFPTTTPFAPARRQAISPRCISG
ncbi:hypothetical protein [Actinokineospora sp.]|uniref:hypothetical protein n=1 Tax=Actinokineospora sp. TaxID=1872133 RepID=UPI003D6ADCF7